MTISSYHDMAIWQFESIRKLIISRFDFLIWPNSIAYQGLEIGSIKGQLTILLKKTENRTSNL